MRSAVTACLGLALCTAPASLLAQVHNLGEKQLACEKTYGNDRPRHCDLREQTVASIGRLSVDAGRNGAVTVKGWDRSDTLVRARVEAQAENESAAALLVSKVFIDGSGGQ